MLEWADLLEHLGSKGRAARKYTPAMRDFIANPPALPPPMQLPRGVRSANVPSLQSASAPAQAAAEVAAPAAEAAPHVPDFDAYLRDAKMDLLNREAHAPDVQHRAGRMESWWRKAIETPEPLSDAVRAQLEQRPGSFMLKAYDALHPQRFPESYAAAVEDAAAAERVPSTTWAHGSDLSLKPEVAAMVNEQAAARNINHASQLPGSYENLTARVRAAAEAPPAAAQAPAAANEVEALLGNSDASRTALQQEALTPTARLAAEPHLTPLDVAEAPPGADVRGGGSPRDPANLEQLQYSAIALARAALNHRQVPQAQLDELRDLSAALASKGRVFRDLQGNEPGRVEQLAKQVTENAATVRHHPDLGRNILEYPPTGSVRPHEAVADNLTTQEYQANRETAREVHQGARVQLDKAAEVDMGKTKPFAQVRGDPAARSRQAQEVLQELSRAEDRAAEPERHFENYTREMTRKQKSVLRSLEDYSDPWGEGNLSAGSLQYILQLAHADMQGVSLNPAEKALVRQYEAAGS